MAKCTTRNQQGNRCQANALRNSIYCYMHDPALAKERDIARKRGGYHKRAPSKPPENIPTQIRRTHDVFPVLDYSLSESYLLGNSVHRNRLLVAIVSSYLDAIKADTFEARLMALENALRKREN